jgi:hypothetical protein
MPTVQVQYQPKNVRKGIVSNLAYELPKIVAPQMNIDGRTLHDGGVGEKEILVDATAYTAFACNVNDLQITVIAHAFQERKDRLDEATEAIKEGVKKVLATFNCKVKVGVSIWLIDMSYTTIEGGQ